MRVDFPQIFGVDFTGEHISPASELWVTRSVSTLEYPIFLVLDMLVLFPLGNCIPLTTSGNRNYLCNFSINFNTFFRVQRKLLGSNSSPTLCIDRSLLG